jgi:DNA repair and recombination protein RAD52
MDWSTITPQLTAKLNPENVKPAKSFGPKGDYIEGWHAIAEANRIFGFNGWSYDIPECTCVHQGAREIGQQKKPGFGVTYTAKVRVIVDGVTREDFGAGHGYDVDCGLAHESAIKEAITDALKRALRTFGNPFGLALYDKSRENVGIDAPPFNARAAADRLIAKMERAKTLPELAEAWEGATAKAIEDANADEFKRLIEAKDDRKAKLGRALTMQGAG